MWLILKRPVIAEDEGGNLEEASHSENVGGNLEEAEHIGTCG
jgi:hypothetical protein